MIRYDMIYVDVVTVQLMESLCRLMKECWHAKPTARLTMLRVKKTLSKLLRDSTTAMASSSCNKL